MCISTVPCRKSGDGIFGLFFRKSSLWCTRSLVALSLTLYYHHRILFSMLPYYHLLLRLSTRFDCFLSLVNESSWFPIHPLPVFWRQASLPSTILWLPFLIGPLHHSYIRNTALLYTVLQDCLFLSDFPEHLILITLCRSKTWCSKSNLFSINL